jgi:hypothetical protein
MSRSDKHCAFEDCERPVANGYQICSPCGKGAEPSCYAHLKDNICCCCETRSRKDGHPELCAECLEEREDRHAS